jgi:hypothetical protein
MYSFGRLNIAIFMKKVLFLAVALLTALNINAETETKGSTDAAAVTNLAPVGTINGDDFNVTFTKLEGREWQAVLTNSTKPFNIVVDDSEWLRDIYEYQGYAERNDSLFIILNHDMEFYTGNAGWKDVQKGQKVILTEIRSLQAKTTKSYFSLTAIEDDQIPFYAQHAPSAKPKVNRRANASVPAPTTPDKKAAKGKKGGKKSKKTEDELIEEILSGNASGFTLEVEGDPKL